MHLSNTDNSTQLLIFLIEKKKKKRYYNAEAIPNASVFQIT